MFSTDHRAAMNNGIGRAHRVPPFVAINIVVPQRITRRLARLMA